MEIAIDLGTANVLVAVRGKGIMLREPSVVATERESGKLMAIGEEARRMLGRTPGSIVATRPLRDGVIADYEITEAMLRYFIARVSGNRSMTRPRVMLCIPTGATGAERRAVREAAQAAGAGKVQLIEEPLAAALGLGLEIEQPIGQMVVDIGGGTSDVAVLTLGGIAASDSVRV
ncbi:rod shape-determining protein MreB, partial [mine drainage metagenome]